MRAAVLAVLLVSFAALGCGGDPPPQRPDNPEAAEKARQEMMKQHQQEFPGKDKKK